jgi:hypothetical protein
MCLAGSDNSHPIVIFVEEFNMHSVHHPLTYQMEYAKDDMYAHALDLFFTHEVEEEDCPLEEMFSIITELHRFRALNGFEPLQDCRMMEEAFFGNDSCETYEGLLVFFPYLYLTQ